MFVNIVFSECEHEDDLDRYVEEVTQSAKRVRSELRVILTRQHDGMDTGFLRVVVHPVGPWFEDFQGCDAFQFSNLLEHREQLCGQWSCRDMSKPERCRHCGLQVHERHGKCDFGWPPNDAEGRVDEGGAS